MDLIEFRRAARRYRIPGLLAALAVVLGGLWAVARHPLQYRATSILLLTPKAELFSASSSASLYRIIFPNVLATARSQPVLDRARQRAPAAQTAEASITASFTADSGVLSIKAVSKRPDAAAAWSEGVATELTDR